MKYTIELPLPHKALSPNNNAHPKGKIKAKAQYRQDVAFLLMDAVRRGMLPEKLPTPVTIHLDFYLCRGSDLFVRTCRSFLYFPKDEDNARGSFKAGQDAIVDAKLIPSDSAANVRIGETRLRTKKSEHQGKACLMLIIETNEPTKAATNR